MNLYSVLIQFPLILVLFLPNYFFLFWFQNESLRGNLLSLENALKEKCLEVQELNIKLKSIVERVEDELTGSNQCQFHIR